MKAFSIVLVINFIIITRQGQGKKNLSKFAVPNNYAYTIIDLFMHCFTHILMALIATCIEYKMVYKVYLHFLLKKRLIFLKYM